MSKILDSLNFVDKFNEKEKIKEELLYNKLLDALKKENDITRHEYISEIQNNVDNISKYSKDNLSFLIDKFTKVIDVVTHTFNNNTLISGDWKLEFNKDKIIINNSNNNLLTISNYVVSSSSPSFFALESGTGNGYATDSKIGHNVQHNTEQCFDNKLRRFTAPVTGNYMFVAGSTKYNSGTLSLQLFVNGMLRNETVAEGTSGTDTFTLQSICRLNEGDYVEAFCKGNRWINVEDQKYNWFGGQLVG